MVVPFDWHIAAAGVIDLDEMDALTRRRFLEVAGTLATGFPATAEHIMTTPRDAGGAEQRCG